MSDAEKLAALLELEPHPEGGYYRRTYCSDGTTSLSRGERPHATAIYFMLEAGQVSAMHRIKSDECWHHYMGEKLLVREIKPDGTLVTHALGKDIVAGERPFAVVAAGSWFGAELERGSQKGDFALVGCTVAPGFDFADFELAKTQELSAKYPAHEDLIRRLAPKSRA